jgi:hypothetical protein
MLGPVHLLYSVPDLIQPGIYYVLFVPGEYRENGLEFRIVPVRYPDLLWKRLKDHSRDSILFKRPSPGASRRAFQTGGGNYYTEAHNGYRRNLRHAIRAGA